ncbi:MAG: TolB family protein [Thermomicrobiales bacterium]
MKRSLKCRYLLLLLLIVGLSALPVTTIGQESTPPGRIAFGRTGDIWVWENGESDRLVVDGHASDPRWSPSGQELLYVRTGDSFSDLYLRYLGSGDDVRLTSNQPQGQIGTLDYANNSVWAISPAWSPSGLIAYASDYFTPNGIMTLWLIADLSSGPFSALSAQAEGTIDDVTLSSDGGIAGYTVRETDAEGVIHTYVVLRDLTDGVAYEVADDPDGVFDPAISPDDQTVAVAIRDGDTTDIWNVERATGARHRVTSDANALAPVWSPDGQWLAYVRMVDFEFELWAVPVQIDGFGEPRQLEQFKDIDAPGGLSWTIEG